MFRFRAYRFLLILTGMLCSLSAAQGQQPPSKTASGSPTTATALATSPAADRPWAKDTVVRKQVEKGISLVNAKKFKEAVAEFTAAAKQYPQDGTLRHLLGFAMFQNQQAGPAWLQFRAAVRLALSHEPGVRDFLAIADIEA